MFSKFIKAIAANFKTKLLALVIALGIWFYASSQLTDERVVSVQLELKPPPDYVMVYTSTREVDVRVSGPASALEALERRARMQPPRIQHQLTEADVDDGSGEPRLDEVTIQLQPQWIDFRMERWQSDRLRVQSIDPREVTVVAEPVVEELVPVDIRPPVGLELTGALDWTPDQVTVRGPAAIVSNMTSIGLAEDQTLYNIAAGRGATEKALERRVSRMFNGERISVSIAPDPARVDVILTERAPESEQEEMFEGIPVHLLVPIDFPFAARVPQDQPRTVTVQVRAMPDALSRLKRRMEGPGTAITAYVDLGNLPIEVKPGERYTELVRVRLPNDVIIKDATVPDPENPNVTLELTIVLDEKPATVP